MTQVALIKCANYNADTVEKAIARQFELLGGVEKFVKRSETVLLKPNFIAPKPRYLAVQTDPAVIIAVAKLLKDFGAKPFVGDSPAWGDVFGCAKSLELDVPLKKLGVQLKQLDNPRKCYIAEAHTNVGISSAALNADKIINLPKFKTHQQLAATFAIKNMFGTVSGKAKAYWHFARGKDEEKFCKLLIGIYKYLSPTLTIIDGITAMDGPGPINGRARPLGFLIAGNDPIACSKLIDILPTELPIVLAAKKIPYGIYDYEQVEFLGDKIEICCDFERAAIIPIRFSLPRVCKSVAKQLFRKLQSNIIKR